MSTTTKKTVPKKKTASKKVAEKKEVAKKVAPKKRVIKNPLHPVFDPALFVDEEGNVITPFYIPGAARDYRLHMGTGVLTLSDGQQITKPLESFKVIPVAIRCLQGKLFLKNEEKAMAMPKKWAEVYFINEKGNLCLFMFNGFSYDNLSIAFRSLLYDYKKLTEVVWTITFQAKVNKQNKAFCIADFSFEEIPAEDLPTVRAVYQNIEDEYYHIYREGTKYEYTLYQENWSNGSEKTEKQKADEAANQQALLAEFATPEEKEEAIKQAIETAESVEELTALWNNNTDFQEALKPIFKKKRELIETAEAA